MSENKSVDAAIDIINNGGFKAGQMQAVVAKNPYWTIEKLQELWPTEAEFVNAWTDPHIATCNSQARKVKAFDRVPVKNRFKVLLQKAPAGFFHVCNRGQMALRINGLLKQKCKKGMRRNYALSKQNSVRLTRAVPSLSQLQGDWAVTRDIYHLGNTEK